MSGPSEIATASAAVNFERPAEFRPLRVEFSIPEDERRRMYVLYPEELAACAQIIARPCDRFVLQEIVRLCDDDGKSWPSVDHLARLIPRSGKHGHYSPITVRVALRRLRDAGLLVWQRVWPFGRFPPASRKAGTRGRWTPRGGRVWFPNLPVLSLFAKVKRASEAREEKERAKRSEVIERKMAAARELVTVAPPEPPGPWVGLRNERSLLDALGVEPAPVEPAALLETIKGKPKPPGHS